MNTGDRATWYNRHAAVMRNHEERDALRAHYQPATYQEYAEWVGGYIRGGGLITHGYDFFMPYNTIQLLTSYPAEGIPSLQSPYDVKLIVPRAGQMDVRTEQLYSQACGQQKTGSENVLYFMDGYRLVAHTTYVPMYTDVWDWLAILNDVHLPDVD